MQHYGASSSNGGQSKLFNDLYSGSCFCTSTETAMELHNAKGTYGLPLGSHVTEMDRLETRKSKEILLILDYVKISSTTAAS